MTIRASRSHLKGLIDVIQANGAGKDLLQALPKDPQTCSDAFDIDPLTHQYVCCPVCHCLYAYDIGEIPTGDVSSWPRCTYKGTPTSSSCSAQLWRPHQISGHIYKPLPLKIYHHQDLKSWVGRLVSRKGIEQHLALTLVAKAGSSIDDIGSSRVFIELKDAHGNVFLPPPPGEGRLVFGLSVDSFDPFGNQAAKQSYSATGVWMVLLSLPWHLRHLRENMYLAGVIPGPSKPSTDAINLRLLGPPPGDWICQFIECARTVCLVQHRYQRYQRHRKR